MDLNRTIFQGKDFLFKTIGKIQPSQPNKDLVPLPASNMEPSQKLDAEINANNKKLGPNLLIAAISHCRNARARGWQTCRPVSADHRMPNARTRTRRQDRSTSGHGHALHTHCNRFRLFNFRNRYRFTVTDSDDSNCAAIIDADRQPEWKAVRLQRSMFGCNARASVCYRLQVQPG
jgi:hypothetical protein